MLSLFMLSIIIDLAKQAKEKVRSALINEAPGRALRRVVDALNAGPSDWPEEAHRDLVALVEAWQRAVSAPPNRYELEQQDASDDKLLAPLPKLLKLELPVGSPNLRDISKDLRVNLAPTGAGAVYKIDYAPRRPWTPWDRAWECFVWLITDPELDRFAGPCRRCKQYFVRKTAKKSVYCSQRCASQDTAIEATIRRRQQAHENKLAAARKGMAEWEKLWRAGRTQKTWKEFTVAYNPAGVITTKFLTRAINNGELEPPQIRKGEQL
jgi:hypothetical protein